MFLLALLQFRLFLIFTYNLLQYILLYLISTVNCKDINGNCLAATKVCKFFPSYDWSFHATKWNVRNSCILIMKPRVSECHSVTPRVANESMSAGWVLQAPAYTSLTYPGHSESHRNACQSGKSRDLCVCHFFIFWPNWTYFQVHEKQLSYSNHLWDDHKW